jgi:hypothetical protein
VLDDSFDRGVVRFGRVFFDVVAPIVTHGYTSV